VWALVRAAEKPKSEEPTDTDYAAAKQGAAILLTAAFTGLRLGELLALRIRDIDFPASVIRVMGERRPARRHRHPEVLTASQRPDGR